MLLSSRISTASANISGGPSPLGWMLLIRLRDSCTEQDETSGRRIPPTETNLAAGLSFSPLHTGQSKSVIHAINLFLVLSEVVSA